MAIFTVPFSLICGFTRRVRPILALDGLERVDRAAGAALALVKVPVTKGTFWPMTILASLVVQRQQRGAWTAFALARGLQEARQEAQHADPLVRLLRPRSGRCRACGAGRALGPA